jgi:hypothetical protein
VVRQDTSLVTVPIPLLKVLVVVVEAVITLPVVDRRNATR